MCQQSWAFQVARVVVDKAVVYADEQMTSPVGFIRKGKKIKVGDIPRNRAQVYPIILAGKVAYIRVLDLDTEKERVDSDKLVAERFQRNTHDELKTNYALEIFNYTSQISLGDNSDVKNKESVNWLGFGIRGGAQVSPKWDFDLITNYLTAKKEEVKFQAIEFGVGGSFRVYDHSRFKAKLFGQLLAIPFATYAYADKFRVNGYGYSTGGGLNLTYRLGRNIGIEALAGLYYMKLMSFDAPKPYKSIDPGFIGTRIGLGLNYQF